MRCLCCGGMDSSVQAFVNGEKGVGHRTEEKKKCPCHRMLKRTNERRKKRGGGMTSRNEWKRFNGAEKVDVLWKRAAGCGKGRAVGMGVFPTTARKSTDSSTMAPPKFLQPMRAHSLAPVRFG